MSLTCLRTRARLAARRAGLPEAERIAIETHLEHCEACRAEAHALDALAGVADQALGQGARGERALGRLVGAALREATAAAAAAKAKVAPAAARPALAAPWRIMSVVAAGVCIFLVLEQSRVTLDDNAGVRAARAAGAVRPESLRVRALAPGAPAQLAHAQVTLAPGGAARWDEATRTIELTSGRVDVAVDPAARRSFHVRTPRFTVEVLGTEFSVTPAAVVVRHGKVRVRGPDGRVLADGVSAGGRWELAAPPAAPTRLAPATVPPRPGEVLAEARTRLGRGEVAGARKLVGRVLASRPGRTHMAEAETLLAECSLVEGRPGVAAARFAHVAAEYADLPAGESALFAAAVAHSRARQGAEARKLARQYLERYPKGRFRAEAAALK